MSDEQNFEAQEWSLPRPRPDHPNIARVYDYLLDGKDHYAADRAVGDRIKKAVPDVWLGVRQQRAVLRRAVRHLVSDLGLTQLIDVGTGLPSAGNVHEVAHAIDPAVRVAYVDNDPVVLAHGRALLADNPETVIVEGDLRKPAELLASPDLTALIDLDRPVGLILCGILHYIHDDEDPAGLTGALASRLVPGSAVFVHHLSSEGPETDPRAAAIQGALEEGIGRGRFRTKAEVTALLDGLDGYTVEEPGVVPVPLYRPDAETPALDENPVLRMAVAGSAVRR